MAICSLSNTEIMTHYYVRVRGISSHSTAKDKADHLFLSLDCDPADVAAYLSEHLKYGEVYRFIWSPKDGVAGVAVDKQGMDTVEGVVASKADIDAMVAHYPFGGLIPRPYLTTEEYAVQQSGNNIPIPPKPISEQKPRPFGG